MSDTYDGYPTGPAAWGDLTGQELVHNPWEPLPYADLTDIQGNGPSPSGAFDDDQYVRLGDGSKASWTGAAWEAYTPAAMAAMVLPTEMVPEEDVDPEPDEEPVIDE